MCETCVQLNSENSFHNATTWIQRHEAWFKEFAQLNGNPVIENLLVRLSAEELYHLPALMLEGITLQQTRHLFEKLYRNGAGLAQALAYAEQNKTLLHDLAKNGADPLTILKHHFSHNIFWQRIPSDGIPHALLRQWRAFEASNDLNWDTMNYYWNADDYIARIKAAEALLAQTEQCIAADRQLSLEPLQTSLKKALAHIDTAAFTGLHKLKTMAATGDGPLNKHQYD